MILWSSNVRMSTGAHKHFLEYRSSIGTIPFVLLPMTTVIWWECFMYYNCSHCTYNLFTIDREWTAVNARVELPDWSRSSTSRPITASACRAECDGAVANGSRSWWWVCQRRAVGRRKDRWRTPAFCSRHHQASWCMGLFRTVKYKWIVIVVNNSHIFTEQLYAQSCCEKFFCPSNACIGTELENLLSIFWNHRKFFPLPILVGWLMSRITCNFGSKDLPHSKHAVTTINLNRTA